MTVPYQKKNRQATHVNRCIRPPMPSLIRTDSDNRKRECLAEAKSIAIKPPLSTALAFLQPVGSRAAEATAPGCVRTAPAANPAAAGKSSPGVSDTTFNVFEPPKAGKGSLSAGEARALELHGAPISNMATRQDIAVSDVPPKAAAPLGMRGADNVVDATPAQHRDGG